MVVLLGESVMLPDACELVVTVRVEDPAVAVIVTDVAFTVCQFKVTLLPASIDAALAEKISVGASPLLSPVQPEKDNRASGIAPQVTQRNNLVFILRFRDAALPKERATFRCTSLLSRLVRFWLVISATYREVSRPSIQAGEVLAETTKVTGRNVSSARCPEMSSSPRQPHRLTPDRVPERMGPPSALRRGNLREYLRSTKIIVVNDIHLRLTRLKLWINTLFRVTSGAYFILTSLYCLLAFLPYTFYFLIKAPAYSWMPWFAHYHPLLYWIAAASLLAGNWDGLRGTGYRNLRFVASFGITVLPGIWVSLHPFLVHIENNVQAYWWSLAALLPFVLITILASVQKDRDRQHHPATFFDYSAAVLSACAVSIVYLLGAALRFSIEGHRMAIQASHSVFIVWTLLSHIVLALLIFSLLNLVSAVACRTRAPRTCQFVVNSIFILAAIWAVLFHFLDSALSFTGWEAQLYSGILALALALWGRSLLLPFISTDVPQHEHSNKNRTWVWITLAGCAAVALAFPFVIGESDWSGFLQSTVTLVLWITCTACMFRVRRRIQGYSPAIVLAVLVLSALTYKGGQATEIFWSKSLGSTDDDISLKLEEYGGHDNSFLLAHHILGNSRNEVCGDLCRILRENTNIRDTRVRNDVRLVDQLTPSTVHRPNIFLFVIDSMRPDYLGAYNPKVDFTPNLDAFAADSIVFRNVYSQYAGTSLSEPAIWSGSMLLHAHYLQPFSRVNSLERMLRVDQYRMVISADEVLSAVLSPSDDIVKLDTDKKLWNELELGSTLRQTETFLDSRTNRDEPVFVYAQPKNVHQFARNDVPSPASQRWPDRPGFHTRVTYEVHWVDSCLGQFFSYLKARGMYENSIIIVTSDHGDATGELGRISHSTSIWPEIMRVPLIVHLPPNMREHLVYDDTRPSTLTDIAPTLYYLLGHRPIRQNPVYGRPLLTATKQELDSYTRRDLLLASDVRAVYGILTSDGRYLYATYDSPAQSYLFDLVADPNAQHNALTPALKQRYDEEIIEQLQTVGDYYGYKPGISSLLASADH